MADVTITLDKSERELVRMALLEYRERQQYGDKRYWAVDDVYGKITRAR